MIKKVMYVIQKFFANIVKMAVDEQIGVVLREKLGPYADVMDQQVHDYSSILNSALKKTKVPKVGKKVSKKPKKKKRYKSTL